MGTILNNFGIVDGGQKPVILSAIFSSKSQLNF